MSRIDWTKNAAALNAAEARFIELVERKLRGEDVKIMKELEILLKEEYGLPIRENIIAGLIHKTGPFARDGIKNYYYWKSHGGLDAFKEWKNGWRTPCQTDAKSITDIAFELLTSKGQPMHYKLELTPEVLKRKHLESKKPWNTVWTNLHMDSKRRFVKLDKGFWGLRLWVDRGNVQPVFEDLDEYVGEPMDLGVLRYTPTTHDGVVAVFVEYRKKLGFPIIEWIRPQYPDACVFERIDSGPRKGQNVKRYVEFELRSSLFKEHTTKPEHKGRKCHYVVCWEHDWPECPIPVIELKKRILGEK